MTPLGEYSGLASMWPSEFAFTTFVRGGAGGSRERAATVCVERKAKFLRARSAMIRVGCRRLRQVEMLHRQRRHGARPWLPYEPKPAINLAYCSGCPPSRVLAPDDGYTHTDNDFCGVVSHGPFLGNFRTKVEDHAPYRKKSHHGILELVALPYEPRFLHNLLPARARVMLTLSRSMGAAPGCERRTRARPEEGASGNVCERRGGEEGVRKGQTRAC